MKNSSRERVPGPIESTLRRKKKAEVDFGEVKDPSCKALLLEALVEGISRRENLLCSSSNIAGWKIHHEMMVFTSKDGNFHGLCWF